MNKPCPFCGTAPKVTLRIASEQEPLVVCKNERCVIWDLSMGQADWEHRPSESRLFEMVLSLRYAADLALREAADRTNYRLKWVRTLKAAMKRATKL